RDWSSDVCSSDLDRLLRAPRLRPHRHPQALPLRRRALRRPAARRPALRGPGEAAACWSGRMSGTWTFVCAPSELLPGEMRTVFDEVTDAPILVVNLDGALYALEDRCSHEDYELSAGPVDPAEGSIECVLHGARFDLRDGRALCAPAYSPVAKFPVRVDATGIWTR